MTAPAPWTRDPEFTPYLNGYLDGLVRHPLTDEREADAGSGRHYTLAQLSAAYDLGREQGRAERPGVDWDIVATAERISDRLREAGVSTSEPTRLPLPRRQHLRHWPARRRRTPR